MIFVYVDHRQSMALFVKVKATEQGFNTVRIQSGHTSDFIISLNGCGLCYELHLNDTDEIMMIIPRFASFCYSSYLLCISIVIRLRYS